MKKYFVGILIITAFLSSCRKDEHMPEIDAFKQGVYYYDIQIDNQKFDNYHMLVIKSNKDRASKKYCEIFQRQSFGIPYFDSASQLRLIQIIQTYEHEKHNAGIYATSSVGSSWLDLSPKIRTLILPSYDFKIEKLPVFDCFDKNKSVLYSNIERNISIPVNGKQYEVYKMSMAPNFNCKEEEQHIVYVDKEIGIIRYEAFHISNDSLMYRLDFNHFVSE